jgi:5-methylcytosine-specific restriction endonuclease McrA
MPYADPEKHRSYYRLRKRRLYAEAVALLGGRCVRCGATADLKIDHKDPGTKEYEISDVLFRRTKVRDRELAKCQLLCSYHHLFKTRVLDTVVEIPF